VRVRKRTLSNGRTIQVEDTPDGAVLSVVVLSQTNVDVLLRHPTAVTLPNGSEQTITELRFFADDPDSLVARAHIVGHPGRGRPKGSG
jgi:voltage-gated potassium channel Kch